MIPQSGSPFGVMLRRWSAERIPKSFQPFRRTRMLQWKARFTALLTVLALVATAVGGLFEPFHLGW
jgi:hypothetical protein